MGAVNAAGVTISLETLGRYSTGCAAQGSASGAAQECVQGASC